MTSVKMNEKNVSVSEFFFVYCYEGLLFLAGGNSNIFYFQPENWGNDPT